MSFSPSLNVLRGRVEMTGKRRAKRKHHVHTFHAQVSLVGGAVAGSVAAFVTTPFDVIKTARQTDLSAGVSPADLWMFSILGSALPPPFPCCQPQSSCCCFFVRYYSFIEGSVGGGSSVNVDGVIPCRRGARCAHDGQVARDTANKRRVGPLCRYTDWVTL